MTGQSYVVVFDRDETGQWIVRVPNVRGCHSYGRTLEQARRRIREALGLWVDNADVAELVEEIRLPRNALAAVRRSREARRRADVERERAQQTTVAAARALIDDVGLGMRDAGDLLGLSHQRVQQLVGG